MKTEISGNTYPIRNKLNLEGFKWDSEKKLWQKDDINIAQYRKYKRKYKRYKGVKIKIIDSRYNRDNQYRNTYFSQFHGGLFGLYRCAYCGKLLRKKDVTIDHIVPVSRAGDSYLCKIFLKYVGVDNVNSVKNLTASCSKCNSRKGNKVNFIYFLRGYSGRTSLGITIRRVFELISVVFLIGIAIELIYLIGGQ